MVATQGKYSSVNTKKAYALTGVRLIAAAAELAPYSMANVLPIASLAGRPVIRQTDSFQSKPSGRITGRSEEHTSETPVTP